MGDKTALYRHFDKEGELLYVGISYNPLVRMKSHLLYSRWSDSISNITIEWHNTRKKAEKAENLAIKKEDPIYNIDGKENSTKIKMIKTKVGSPNGRKTLVIPLELDARVEKIIKGILRDNKRNIRSVIVDILFAYSKEWDIFQVFQKENHSTFGKNRKKIVIPANGDIYNHFKSIEKCAKNFESDVEMLFLFYHENTAI